MRSYSGFYGSVTLKDVAERVGVHVSTVSRALNDSGDPRSSPLRENIRKVAAEMGYRPDPWATSLKTGKTRVIGVLVPALTDVVLATIYEAIEARAQERGYHTFVASTHDDMQEHQRLVKLMLERRVEGLLLGDVPVSAPHLRDLRRDGVPFVLFSRRSAGYPSVVGDDHVGGALVAEHLIERGHRAIGIVGGPQFASTARSRVRGFEEAARKANVPGLRLHVRESSLDVDGGYEAGCELLNEADQPTAVFAVNDLAAIGAMSAVRAAGLNVGTEIAVVGYNDIPLSKALPIQLSSVHVSHRRIGSLALDTLLTILTGRRVRSVVLAPTLRVRESSSMLARSRHRM